MDGLDLAAIRDDCEQEAARENYPADFPGLPLMPAARYFDQRFYDLEMERVWRKTWLLAAHVSDLPSAGSYKLFDQLGESVIVMRGQDNAIRAFHNVCMHRGSPLVTETRGKIGARMVCPYHAWTYSSSGELLTVPEERNFACLDRPSLALTPVRCETWRGHVFINLDDAAPPLAAHLGSLPNYCEDFPFEGLEVKRYTTVEIDCNWKVAYDNFIEIYHIATVHPAIMRWLEPKTFSISLLKNGHSFFRTKRRNGNRIVSGEVLTPEGEHDLFQTYAINLPLFPNVAGGLDAGGFNWTIFWPKGPNKTIIELPHYGAIGVDDPVYWDNLMTEALRLIGEDLALLPGVQKAMESGRIKNIPLSYHERGIYWYQEEIDRRIGVERIPEELRIEQVLGAYAID